MCRPVNEKAIAQDLDASTGKTRLIANVEFSFTSRTNSTSPAPASSLFFHGHGATLGRDVLDRQKVPAQISASGINAVLVAPQFAVDARDSSAGKFWEPGAFDRFVREAANKLAKLHGDPRASQAFANMPVVIVAYSGGYLATAWCLKVGGVQNRIRGVVLLDALYGEVDKFAAWIAKNRTTFFVSAYTDSTQRKNATLKTILARQKIAYETDLKQQKWQHGVTFLSTNSNVGHWNFVTRAGRTIRSKTY